MTSTRDNTRVLCLMALVAMSTTIISCHAAGTTGLGITSTFTKLCVAAKGCAPPIQPSGNVLCKAYCVGQGYNKDKSYCSPDNGGMCCCEK
ncbi:hypothetical protein TRIUR3_31890 [Triticum urartu]|uniref:Uncharacterized protein n=1 Tax=Triticum urartu TaxID=4572 RepID=M8A197_TRIUA|nr:hypothetical protein TRIUR3_31890 [Triticum urartu]